MTNLQKAKEYLSENRLNEALQLLTDANDAETLFVKGKILWRMGYRPEATTAFNQAVAIDPNSPAKMALEQAREIEAFFNPDLLNP